MKLIFDHRKLLSASEDSSLADLKSIYRNLMKQYHPDKFQDEKEKLEAEEKSKAIIEAYHFLVSIAPETIEAALPQYHQTISEAMIDDYQFKSQVLTVTFSDGSVYEYFDVPKSIYVKLNQAPSTARFARRHIFNEYPYRSTSRIVAE